MTSTEMCNTSHAPSTGLKQESFSKMILNELNDQKGLENIICTMMMHGEMFYGCHTTYSPAAVEINKFSTVRSFGLVVVVVSLFYVHGKHPRSCRDGQLT